jgi:PhzF family phenazine biosynthesis protein
MTAHPEEMTFVSVNTFVGSEKGAASSSSCSPLAAHGNPATVCFAQENDGVLFQRIASEIAPVEAVFMMPTRGDVKADFCVRFFTKLSETHFAGHPLIAAAEAVFASYRPEHTRYRNAKELHFLNHSDKNVVVVRRLEDNKLELSLKPTLPAETKDPQLAAAAARCLQLPATAIRAIFTHHSGKNLIVLLTDADFVPKAKPERNGVLALLGSTLAKLTVTARVDKSKAKPANGSTNSSKFSDYDIVSRLFAPRISIDEDTCSAASHAMIGLLFKCLEENNGKMSNDLSGVLRAYQASERGGDMTLSFAGPRVGVSGRAQVTAWGRYMLMPQHHHHHQELPLLQQPSKL